jgi:hypothetical protein
MKTFNEFQYDKKIERLRNDILRMASKLSLEQLSEMENIFEGPFQSNSMLGNIGSGLKSAWNSYQGQRTVNNTDNPVGNGYNQLAQSLDSFIKTVSQHPVGKNQNDLLNILGKFKQNLSAQGSELASQMKQYNANNAIDKIQSQNGQQPQNGQPLQNANQANPAGGLNTDDVVSHMRQQGIDKQTINAYRNQVANNQAASGVGT